MLLKDQIKSIVISFYRDKNITLEKHLFEFDKIKKKIENNNNDKFLIEFEQEIQKIILDLDNRMKELRQLPNNVEFQIFINTTESGLVNLINCNKNDEFPWIKEIESEYLNCLNNDKRIIPIHNLQKAGLQYLIEEFL